MKKKLILIGASTGGPGHLKYLFKTLPSSLTTPIIVAQHMNAVFIPSFVQQFRTELSIPVTCANHTLTIDKGGLYICEKNCLLHHNSPLKLVLEDAPKETLYNPSVDDLFLSAVPLCGEVEILAILLTGIGHDGAKGIAHLHRAGAKCIGESEESAVVYGMPKRAKELVPELQMLTLHEIKQRIERFTHVLF